MVQKEKQLLLKDLSARLLYGVICHTEIGNGHLCSINQTIFGTEYGLNISPVKRDYFNDSKQDEVVIKPYLRPISSMTEEEAKTYRKLNIVSDFYVDNGASLDYLNSIHIDYRGLIEKGLALEAPKDMYKTE